jgi:DNA-binding transcriptional regulator YiaG
MDEAETMPERELTSAELEEARQYALVVEWSPEDDVYVVSIPDIPGIHTHGATRAEAATAGEEVLALWLSARRRSGHHVPRPRFNARYATKALPTLSEAHRVRGLRQRLDVSQRDFANMLNVSVGTVRSWEQGLRSPDGASLRLLDIAERQPEVLLNAASLAARRA